MKERPILMSAPMVRAIRSGAKTQTRRLVKPEGAHHVFQFRGTTAAAGADEPTGDWGWCGSEGVVHKHIRCLYGVPGDRLWVREAWRTIAEADRLPPRDLTPAHRIWFEAEAPHQPGTGRYRPPMFMPRWASRITLDLISVRVERLQDISRGDAMAEGCPFPNMAAGEDPRAWYAELWEQLNGQGSWGANPWVWVLDIREA